MIELTYLKELMLIRQVNQKSAISVTIVFFFQMNSLSFKNVYAIDVYEP